MKPLRFIVSKTSPLTKKKGVELILNIKKDMGCQVWIEMESPKRGLESFVLLQ